MMRCVSAMKALTFRLVLEFPVDVSALVNQESDSRLTFLRQRKYTNEKVAQSRIKKSLDSVLIYTCRYLVVTTTNFCASSSNLTRFLGGLAAFETRTGYFWLALYDSRRLTGCLGGFRVKRGSETSLFL